MSQQSPDYISRRLSRRHKRGDLVRKYKEIATELRNSLLSEISSGRNHAAVIHFRPFLDYCFNSLYVAYPASERELDRKRLPKDVVEAAIRTIKHWKLSVEQRELKTLRRRHGQLSQAVHGSQGALKKLDAAHRKLGQFLVAMPVLGNPDMAAKRELFILLGGPPEAIERCRPVIARLGQRSFHVSDKPWLASAMKLAGNTLTAATLQSMGEVFAFLAKAGVPPERTQEILTGSLFDGHVHKAYGQKIVDHRYSPPGMTVPLAGKDLRLLLPEAEHNTVPMPLASLLHDRLVAVEARGWSELDWSALGKLAAFEAGIP